MVEASDGWIRGLTGERREENDSGGRGDGDDSEWQHVGDLVIAEDGNEVGEGSHNRLEGKWDHDNRQVDLTGRRDGY